MPSWYEATPENEAQAKRVWEIINALVDKEEELYRVLREDGDKIAWD